MQEIKLNEMLLYTELKDLCFDCLKAQGYEGIEEVTAVTQSGLSIFVNANFEGFTRKEDIQIQLIDLITFVYKKTREG
jgi:hypothetical protein